MTLKKFIAQFPTKNVADSLKNTVTPTIALKIDTDEFSISVNSLGTTTYKIKYADGQNFKHSFHITECRKYFPFSKYKGLTADMLDDMEEKVVICLFGEHMIEHNRDKAKKEFFSSQKKDGKEDVKKDGKKNGKKNGKKVYFKEVNLDGIVESEDSSSSIADIIADPSAVDPIDIVLRKEFFSIFGEKYKSLTDKQKIVIDGLLAGKSKVDIAREEGVDATAIRDRHKCAKKILKYLYTYYYRY